MTAVAAAAVAQLLRTDMLPPVPDEPDDVSMAVWVTAAIQALPTLSSGEKLMVGVVRAVWNGTGDVRLGDVLHGGIDATLRWKVIATIRDAMYEDHAGRE